MLIRWFGLFEFSQPSLCYSTLDLSGLLLELGRLERVGKLFIDGRGCQVVHQLIVVIHLQQAIGASVRFARIDTRLAD